MLPINWKLLELALNESRNVYGLDSHANRRKQFADRVLISNDSTSSFASVHEAQGYCVVAFKGSAEIRDWRINAQAVPYRYAGSWVHWGFASAHAAIWPEILKYLQNKYTGLPILLTGHSLGGAMAELSALQLKQLMDFGVPIHMITFGKPNVFFMPALPKLEGLATQLSVVSGSDAVAKIPRFLFGPDLGQTTLYLANNGNDHVFQHNSMIGDFPFREYIRRDCRLADLGSDHFLSNYTQRITQILERVAKTPPAGAPV